VQPSQETEAHSPSTLWPYGLPEYHVEVPEGYEGLLPAEESTKTETAKPGASDYAVSTAPPVAKPSPLEALPFPIAHAKSPDSPRSEPALIIVIDDAGHNLEQLDPFLKLPFPLTIAVLPGLAYSVQSADRIRASGKELILHQPMQALGGTDPGPGAISLDMTPTAAAEVLASNLDSLGSVAGINNHMGSALTRDPERMRAVLDIVKMRGIYYLDSLTSSGTATAALCREMELPYWERDVFLDNSGDKQSILHALEEGKKTASAQGAAVMIGHVWSSELAQTLMDIYPQLVEEGYSLSTISHYMIKSAMGEADARPGD